MSAPIIPTSLPRLKERKINDFSFGLMSPRLRTSDIDSSLKNCWYSQDDTSPGGFALTRNTDPDLRAGP
ncbi:hypothetical protein CDEST_06672 [Colletotrichum destructivum]|uniref:Uncharacterized protein n=1 Tax=Colletotrichum destructivum TaxID=34406 RepID=A0AAX4IFA0_9PEZI|nr:hypothetical protein CDEST_06672 [Colletotrichum destructivum]